MKCAWVGVRIGLKCFEVLTVHTLIIGYRGIFIMNELELNLWYIHDIVNINYQEI